MANDETTIRAHDIERLRQYVEWWGGIHEPSCPADDTCDCSGKSINDAVNHICRVLVSSDQALTGEPTILCVCGHARSHHDFAYKDGMCSGGLATCPCDKFEALTGEQEQMDDLKARAKQILGRLDFRCMTITFEQTETCVERNVEPSKSCLMCRSAGLVRDLLAALLHAREERDKRIEPLQQSDDPEQAEAIRVTPDYVLMTPQAYQHDAKVWHQRITAAREERDRLRETLTGDREDLIDSLHDVFTRHGIASRSDLPEGLIGDLVSWAARKCREATQCVHGNPKGGPCSWCDLRDSGGIFAVEDQS